MPYSFCRYSGAFSALPTPQQDYALALVLKEGDLVWRRVELEDLLAELNRVLRQT